MNAIYKTEEEIKSLVKQGIKACGSAQKLAEKIEMSVRTIHSWKNGERIPERVNIEKVEKFLREDGFSIAEEASEYKSSSESIPIPYESAELSMGGGSFIVSTKIKGYLGFRKEWLQQKGKPSAMSIFRATGYSMEPTIPDPAIVLIDKSQTIPVNDKIYFIAYGDGIMLKRLNVENKDGKKIITHIVSDGLGPYKEPIRQGEYFEIIGKALWFAADLP